MHKTIIGGAVAAALSSGAGAQTRDTELAGRDRLVAAPVIVASVADASRVFVSSEIAGGRVVKGAPYSATATSETTQTLMDGNRIVRSASTRLARDGEGRTRQERSDGSVYLHDPVAGKSWLLRPRDKSAIELPRPMRMHVGEIAGPLAHNAEEVRSWADAMRQWAHDFRSRWGEGRSDPPEAKREGTRAPAAPAAGESRVIVARSPKGEGDAQAERDVRVEVVSAAEAPRPPRPGVPPVPPMPPMPPVMGPLSPGSLDALPLAVRMPREGGVVTPLGKRDFDGVSADGTRTAWTIPAGRIGNDKPIEILSERWYAPDLVLVVQTRYFDPRSGEATYKLTQLRRGEPDAALFAVPSDYTVRTPRERRERPETPGTPDKK
jgi:hypothetical protein